MQKGKARPEPDPDMVLRGKGSNHNQSGSVVVPSYRTTNRQYTKYLQGLLRTHQPKLRSTGE